ncbi:MAG: (2Fe-2S)-binding protein [Anaerolineaceae bacterium]
MMRIKFNLNGKSVEPEVHADQTLLNLLRDSLGMIGVKEGCSMGECGTCSILVNGELRKSCIMLAPQVDGCDVVTIEGIALEDGSPNDLQQAFLDHGSVQCGYCTPGMVIASEAILLHNPSPTREQIRQGISGNLCRCTGYQQIIGAIEETAKKRQITVEEK